MPYQLPFRVRWGDCDPAGIVYYPRFLEYMNDATHGLIAAKGFGLTRMDKEFGAVGFPMVSLTVDYRSPMTLDDEGVVESVVLSIGRSSLVVGHTIRCGTRLVAEARETRVFTARNPDGALEGRPVPDELRQALLEDNR